MAADEKPASSRLEDARARMYRDLIFESAECVFGERGFDGATMQDIAGEAGVSLKTVYATYPGKQELFDAILHERGSALYAHVREAQQRASEQGPPAALAAMIRAFVEYLFDHRDWLAIHLRSRIAWSVQPSHETAAGLWRQGIADIERLISAGIASGHFAEGDAAELAVIVTTLMKVEVTIAIDRGETEAAPVVARTTVLLRRLLGAHDAEPAAR